MCTVAVVCYSFESFILPVPGTVNFTMHSLNDAKYLLFSSGAQLGNTRSENLFTIARMISSLSMHVGTTVSIYRWMFLSSLRPHYVKIPG